MSDAETIEAEVIESKKGITTEQLKNFKVKADLTKDILITVLPIALIVIVLLVIVVRWLLK